MASFCNLSPEIQLLILKYLSAKELLNLSECNRALNEECIGNNGLWKLLCLKDFDVELQIWEPFESCHELYKLIYKARVILEETCNVTLFCRAPDWMYVWFILSKEPPSFAFRRLPKGTTKAIWNDLLSVHSTFFKQGITWKESYELALNVYGSLLKFQQHTLRKCARSQRKVNHMYPKQVRLKRERYFQTLKLEDKYSAIDGILLKENTQDQVSASSVLCQPQKIGVDFIEGRLHRFGRRQLKEYIKCGQILYDQITVSKDDLSAEDIVFCLTLIYEQLGDAIFGHFYTFSEFLDLSQHVKSRLREIRTWLAEKGLNFYAKYRKCDEVKEFDACRNFLWTGEASAFQQLKTLLMRLDNISLWMDKNKCIIQYLSLPIREVLNRKKPSVVTDKTSIVSHMVWQYLDSGEYKDFLLLLRTVTIMKTQLKPTSYSMSEGTSLLGGIVKFGWSNIESEGKLTSRLNRKSASEESNSIKSYLPAATKSEPDQSASVKFGCDQSASNKVTSDDSESGESVYLESEGCEETDLW